jgi:phosphomannomutase
MGAVKKQYKKYTVEEDQDNAQDKKVIEQYVEKIQQQLENDTQMQKKAASVILEMMNSNNKK